jgi:hypothetical protein
MHNGTGSKNRLAHSSLLSCATVITERYKNTQNARRFLKSQLGEAFKFDRPFMAWFKANRGKTLGDAASEYRRRTSDQWPEVR